MNFSSKFSKKALVGGKDSDGSKIYVGRAFHAGLYLPAKIIPSKQSCYVGLYPGDVVISFIESY